MPKAQTTATVRRRRQRGSISPEEILNGAFEVARGASLDQLSMPTLAEHLDVGVTSIYWYFRKKDDLLNAMTDVAMDKYIQSMPKPRAEDPWQHTLVEHFRAMRGIHHDDEILCDLLLIRTSTYSRDAVRRLLESVEAIVATLVDAGFSPSNALLVFNTMSVYTRGAIIGERILRLSHAPTLDTRRQRRMTDWATMPVLESLLDRHPLAGTSDEDFEFALDRMLPGLEALLDVQDARVTKRGATRKATSGRARTAR